MVRINLINPKNLADQHLIAEYNEILMLLGYVERFPKVRIKGGISEIPSKYTLNKGHMKFFKDKLKYIQSRHELIKKEMIERGFRPTKRINLNKFPKNLHNDWKPKKRDLDVIIDRIAWKISKKPGFYRYYGKQRDTRFLMDLLKK